ncbi:hypothetical protein [Emticicia sp. 17c]|uniref:hypothetical protein n=1 Tax=Emticicia sp. 17c TaxID=3127704 RepID=UPI00301BC93A
MTKKLSIILITLTILWGCADELLPSPTGNQLKGVIKAFVLKTASSTTKTIWEYDVKTKIVTGFKTYNVADNALLNSEVYVRDTTGKVLSAKVVFADTKQNYDRTYEYNNLGRLAKVTETLASGEQYIEKYTYGAEGKLTEYLRQLIKGNSVATQRYVGYKWKSGNIETMTESTIKNGYEEQDFQYGVQANLLAKLYQTELKLPRMNPEEITDKYPTNSEKLFAGIKYTYSYETNTEGKLTKQIINQIKEGQTSLESELTIEYY